MTIPVGLSNIKYTGIFYVEMLMKSRYLPAKIDVRLGVDSYEEENINRR